jgi:hypothetical protein
MADRRCPSCGLNNFDWLNRCGRCGAVLPRLAIKEQSPATNSPWGNSEARSTVARRKKWAILDSPLPLVILIILFAVVVFYSLVLFARFLEKLSPSSSESDIVWVIVCCYLVLFFSVGGIAAWFQKSKQEIHWILHLILLLAVAYVLVAGFILAILAKALVG